MNLALLIRHERRLLHLHGAGCVCARLAALMVLLLALGFAWASALVVWDLLLGPQPLAIGRPLIGRQSDLLLLQTVLGLISLYLAWLAFGLWQLNLSSWWLAVALCAAALGGFPDDSYILPSALARLMLILLLSSLVGSRRVFRDSTVRA